MDLGLVLGLARDLSLPLSAVFGWFRPAPACPPCQVTCPAVTCGSLTCSGPASTSSAATPLFGYAVACLIGLLAGHFGPLLAARARSAVDVETPPASAKLPFWAFWGGRRSRTAAVTVGPVAVDDVAALARAQVARAARRSLRDGKFE